MIGEYGAAPRRRGCGDRRVGVVWHTQGSGKSLTMAIYAGRVVLEPAMRNPTIVVITDRNDLDDQLFGTFARCQELLRLHYFEGLGFREIAQRLGTQESTQRVHMFHCARKAREVLARWEK